MDGLEYWNGKFKKMQGKLPKTQIVFFGIFLWNFFNY